MCFIWFWRLRSKNLVSHKSQLFIGGQLSPLCNPAGADGTRELPGVSFREALISFKRTPSVCPNHFHGAPPLNTITLRVRMSTCESGEVRDLQISILGPLLHSVLQVALRMVSSNLPSLNLKARHLLKISPILEQGLDLLTQCSA